MLEERLGKKIKDVRLKEKLSQDRFGKRIGISGKSISAYECGRSIPSLKLLEKLDNEYHTTFISETATDKVSTKLQDIKRLIKDIELYLTL
jgi:transcriptional regulator with XRE-family HTH domain